MFISVIENHRAYLPRLILAAVAMTQLFIFTPQAQAEPEKYAKEQLTYLEQNWSPQIRRSFYNTPQGALLIPLNFALALKDSQSGHEFFTSSNLERFGFLPQKPDHKTNPLGLPVGLTIDGYAYEGPRYIGMTCAACHTNNLKYNGNLVRIDGGQSILNFQKFMEEMDRSVFSVAQDSTKLTQYLKRVRKLSPTLKSEKQLRADFKKFVDERAEWRQMNSSSTRYGYGRTDAFGVIYNQVLARSLHVPANAQEPNAPVSFPVLWDTSQHDFVQWNGFASNDPAFDGPLARNIGQVLGVFGAIDLFHETKVLKGYCTSARRENLLALEKSARTLVSPAWPENILGQLDSAKVTHGKALYDQRCLQCHTVLNDTRSPERTIKALLIPSAILGVDNKLGVNIGRMAESGVLQGRLNKLTAGRPLDAVEPAALLLKTVVSGALAGSISFLDCNGKVEADPVELWQAWRKQTDRLQNPLPPDAIDQLPAAVRNALVRQGVDRLKARPLNGIWASPPFLHNGSVKNIYELLLAPAARSAKFVLGCADYDPLKLGYECGSPDAVKSNDNLSVLDTSVDGSRNSGHDYGQGLSESDRYDLIEYLKTL